MEKEYKNRIDLKAPNSNLPQVKQILFCQQARYDRGISLKAAAEIVPPCQPQYLPEGN